MKQMNLLLMIWILSSCSFSQTVHECVLGVRVLPLRYVGETQTMEFRLNFKSNCLDFSTLNFFVLPFNVNLGLTETVHPTRVILRLFRKSTYIFDFQKPKRVNFRRFTSIAYQGVRARFSQAKGTIRTSVPNNIILRTPSESQFTINEISTLALRRNPALCRLAPSRRTMLCEIN